MTSALRKLCGMTKMGSIGDLRLAKLAAGPVGHQSPGIMRRADQSISNAAETANDYRKAFWDTYKGTDGCFWYPSKSTEDNLRGYAETVGEVVGGIGGAVGGGIGGTAVAGPAGGVGGAIGAGYIGGKGGKSLGRNAFNLVCGSNGTQGGGDSMGRNTGYGVNNGAHGNDFIPQWHDTGYLIPAAGGALKVPLNQGLKPTLKPMANHLQNIIGRRGLYDPVYESLPWWQRYMSGPEAKLHPYLNTAKPSITDIDPNKWCHGRRLHTDTGQFSGTNIDEAGRLISDRNLRYQLADDPTELLYAGGIDTESFLVQKGMLRESAERLLKNKGGIGAHFGKGYLYDYPGIHTAVPPNAKPGLTRIEQQVFLDIRKLTDAQAAQRSLTGQRVENGRRVPVMKNDGNAPSYSGINADALKRELDLHPENNALRVLYDRLRRPYDPSLGRTPELTVAPSRMPTQGYTKINAPGYSSDTIYPWMMRDETPALAPLNILSNGIGVPYSVLGDSAISND